jgi:glycosyltransferase involved in cell wall biosynthesis
MSDDDSQPGPSDEAMERLREAELTSQETVDSLGETFVAAMKDGRGRTNPYVAAPAPGHDVHGLWHCFGAGSRSGYATHAVGLHWVLHNELGVATQLVPHRHHDIDIDEFPADRSDMLFEWHREGVGHPHALFCSYPPEVAWEMRNTGPPLVPYIAFEGDRVSDFTRQSCEAVLDDGPKAFRDIWVVHPFVKEALVAGGVDKGRIHVAFPMLFGGPWEGMGVPWGPAMSWPAPDISPDDPFVFGAMGTWHERKGFPDLLRAYFSAFKREDPVQLVIRTSTFGAKRTIREFKEYLTGEIADIASEFGDHGFPGSKKQPKLRLVLGTAATDAEVLDWLGSLDCFVGPSYGEGLGIPHIWAKGQGVPMIATGFGAVGELLSSIQMAGGADDEIVPYQLTPVHPEMPKLALMFDRETQWGGYEWQNFATAMQVQFERGRRLDTVGADFVRERHGLVGARADVVMGLRRFIDPQLLQDWGLGE